MSDALPKKDDDVVKSIGALREAIDNKHEVSIQKFKEIEEKAFKAEAANQDLVKKLTLEEKAREDLATKLELVEKKLVRPQGGEAAGKEVFKAYQEYLQKGKSSIDARQLKTLRTDINEDGGFLTRDPEIMEGLVKDITEISDIRQLARVRRTTTESLKVRRRKSLLNSDWKGQLETSDTDHSKYGILEIPVNKLPVTVDISREMLMYDDVNIVNELQLDAAEDFAENEGFAFVNGDGVKKPEGFLVNSEVVAAAITSASAGVVEGDDFATLFTSLKVGYNPVFGFNRTTWGQIINLKDSGGEYLINHGDLSAGVAATLRGIRFVIIQDMPDVAGSALAVVCADFQRGYTIADGVNLEIIRDEFTRKKEGVVEFQFTRFVGGQVVQPEAFALLSIQ